VLEAPVRGEPIPVRRESVVAFVGSAPRGPVGIPVAVQSLDEYRRRFGVPGYRGRVQDLLAQFFDNGGIRAIVVRVSGSERRRRLVMPGPAGDLVLNAVNPGPHECLRASIDYDSIPAGDSNRFNLVIHRLASRDRPLVEDQEIYRCLTIDAGDPDFFAQVLLESDLVRADGPAPMARPEATHCPGIEVGAAYQYAGDDWREGQTLTDYDLIGCDRLGTGIFALDRVSTFDFLCLVPDADDVGPVALFAAERYCRSRHALLLVDPPSTWTSVTDVAHDRISSVFTSPNVATYFPRPAPVPGTGLNRTPSALGALAGRLVAGGSENGIWELRDPLILRGRVRLACQLNEREQSVIRRLGVNALRECGGGYLQASGLVTMGRGHGLEAEWSDLRLRRIGLHIIGSIARGTRWAAFATDDRQTWIDVRQQVADFMDECMHEVALHDERERGTWYITRNSESFSADAAPVDAGHEPVPGLADFVVGFALRDDGNVAFRFVQDRLECRVYPVGWQPGVALAS